MQQSDNWGFEAWLDLGVRVFGLTPDEFWATSLLDWLTLLSKAAARRAAQPMTQRSLTTLIDQFPDSKI